ncbi:serine/threonine protein kinase [Micromonospora rosaria]|uniref:non-specific serine/threonine protein kinase n=1 Tax=Micromonospora rosaria TaxID=47874 RepID=A0A136PQ56_9ACTN|nr:serine/threonine-protein kinase [Micromonospora rosaria]KXK60572.1 serine/threonine protein kinase [Micromonospora rosaria]
MQAGDRVGDRYELTYPIGRGGMGQVWAGYDERLDRPVAIKFLRQAEVPEEQRATAVKRFRREARATARLDHPGVPTVHDLGAYGHDLYLVMQLVPGAVLADHIAENERLGIGEATSIAGQICAVLTAAHAARLVHRDLKPQNLMITLDGVVKVLDFGVAALLDPAEVSRLTATGSTLGSPAYIAPEQAAGRPVGPAADLYALGCILFEMLTGRTPYEATNAPDMLRQHLYSPAPIITEHRPEVPEDLAHLVFCLLAKDPADRPTSAAAVRQLLAPFADHNDILVVGAPGPPRAMSRTIRAVPAPRGRGGLAALRARARELVEGERYAQAVDVLEQALRTVDGDGGPCDEQVLALRLDLADLYLLAGDFRQAYYSFTALAGDLAGIDGQQELVKHCRDQALVCWQELGETGMLGRCVQLASGTRRPVD